MDVPIVVVTYNRPYSLKRLLSSLSNSSFSSQVKLYISIDGECDTETVLIAKNFKWDFGEKEIIEHTENIGLKEHILKCGDLSLKHDGIIVFEDDLFVSPAFYNYVTDTSRYYSSESKVAGISLYTPSYNEIAQLPFIPLADESDVYFMQIPSSWGQYWSREQWLDFRNWLKQIDTNYSILKNRLPIIISNWPESSWKKLFYLFLIEKNKFILYPRISLTTNFGEPGVHFERKLGFHQVPILLKSKKYNLKLFSESYVKYDAYYEIFPETIKLFNPILSDFEFTVDLYGIKPHIHINSEYILTTKPYKEKKYSYGKEFKPIEYNVLFNQKGSDIFFSKFNESIESIKNLHVLDENLFYFYNLHEYQIKQKVFIEVDKKYTTKELFKLLKNSMFNKL